MVNIMSFFNKVIPVAKFIASNIHVQDEIIFGDNGEVVDGLNVTINLNLNRGKKQVSSTNKTPEIIERKLVPGMRYDL